MISYHLYAPDPVAAVAQVNGYLAADGITGITQSANEYIALGAENAANTAWSLDRIAQSGMATASRGEWENCCASGDLGTILTHSGGNLIPSGQYWAYRVYAALTGTRLGGTLGTSRGG